MLFVTRGQEKPATPFRRAGFFKRRCFLDAVLSEKRCVRSRGHLLSEHSLFCLLRLSMSTPTHFAERVVTRSAGPCTLHVLSTPVEGFVSWRGSFLAFPDFSRGDDLLQHLTVSLLDKGTEQRDRFALARVLEDKGATLQVSSDGLYVDVSGQALSEDVPAVMDVLAEMLRSPRFEAEEFEKARAQTRARLQRDMEKTGKQASGELSRHLFPANHPNYNAPFEAQLERLENTTVSDVMDYHAAHFGSNAFTLCMVGDADPRALSETVEDAFSGWDKHTCAETHTTDPLDASPGSSRVPLPDKSNVDVRLGHALPIRRDHEDYVPLYVGNYILGGNFSARLMNEVRDQKGFTYHIGSGLSGVSTRYNGSWKIDVTLSQDKLTEGVEATRKVVKRFVTEGATAEELASKKTTITGSFTVGLATTQRLAHSLLTNAERGFSVSYLDEFPEIIESLTLEEVNTAVQRYLNPDALHVAMAGTIPEHAAAEGA